MAQSFPDLSSHLYRYILEADRAEAGRLLDQAVRKYGFNPIISDVLEPTLRRIGERFAKDKISLAQGYVAGKIAEDLLGKLDNAHNLKATTPRRGTIVLGNAEDDYHGLGRKMIAAFLRVEGWQVEDLGNDVLAERFVDTAERVGARVIGVSAMMLTNALNILKIREELDKRGLSDRIKLAVGGAVFVMRPELVAEVGGDGTALTAMDAPALFDSLDTAAGGGE